MRALSREPQTILNQLRHDGEMIVTKGGQPVILMIDILGQDVVEIVNVFRKSRADAASAKALTARRKEAAKKFLSTVKGLHQEGLTAQEQAALDDLDSGRFKLKLDRQLEL